MLGRLLGAIPTSGHEKSSQELSSTAYKKYSITPTFSRKNYSNEDLEKKARQILQWAKTNGATHYTFLSYPQTEGVSEKQEVFLDLNYSYEGGLSSSAGTTFTASSLLKSQGDGSSFPSGGLRQTHSARAYMMWDTKSDIFFRKRNNVVYIPSLLVAHNGQGLDDKTLLRKVQLKLEERTLKVLEKLGIKAQAAYMALGMEQQLFIIPRSSYTKRLDLRNTGRTIISDVPPRHQQFSDHYYGKIPSSIEDIFLEVEKQLFSIGVPVKTRHKQVAINQFEFCPLYEEVGKAIDHNMIMMEVLKEVFDKNGYTVLLHEKPFQQLNGSGKHCNWSLNYIDQTGKPRNVFSFPKVNNPQSIKLFKLFILINLQALKDYAKLYMASISTPGNELRLGGHEAPPRIISAFLGDAVTNILDNKEGQEAKNLKEDLNLPFNVFQENTDRNRTSPYGFAGNKFQFRAVGSSQNTCYPMAVIGATITAVMDRVLEKLDNGASVDDVINQLTETSKDIRFQGDGYSGDWIQQAKKRGIYVNENFWEGIENLKTEAHVFVDIGACSQQVIQAKYHNSVRLYINTVDVEYKTLWTMISKNILPRGFRYLNQVTNPNISSELIKERAVQFSKAFGDVCEIHKIMTQDQNVGCKTTKEACERRERLYGYSKKVNRVLSFLPKDENFPDLEDFMNLY